MGLCQNLHEYVCINQRAIKFLNIDYEIHPLVPHVAARVFGFMVLMQGLSNVTIHGLTDAKLKSVVQDRLESSFEMLKDVLIYSRYYKRMGKAAWDAGRLEEAVLQYETGVGVNAKFRNELAQHEDGIAANLAHDLACQWSSLAVAATNGVVSARRVNGVTAGVSIQELDQAREYGKHSQTFPGVSDYQRAMFHHNYGIALKNRAEVHTRDKEDPKALAMYKQAAQQIYHGTVVRHIDPDPDPEAADVLSYLEAKIGMKPEDLCSFLEVNDKVVGLFWRGDIACEEEWNI